jgi:hypothetical protein
MIEQAPFLVRGTGDGGGAGSGDDGNGQRAPRTESGRSRGRSAMTAEESWTHQHPARRTAVAAPDSLSASAPRFLVEIIAWVAAPWALAPHSIWPAVLADIALIGLPTVFGMPGAKKQKNPVSIPARPAIVLELLQPVAACVAAFAAWPPVVASLVLVVALAACGLQLRRWRWMLAHPTDS